jgi:hypothetical protein
VGLALQQLQLHHCEYFVKAVSFNSLPGLPVKLDAKGDYSADFTRML